MSIMYIFWTPNIFKNGHVPIFRELKTGQSSEKYGDKNSISELSIVSAYF